MDQLNDRSVVEQQYATATNLQTRISIHDKYSTNKNFTLQNGSEILHKTFSNVQKLEYTDSLSVTNIDDMIEYLYSLSSMTSITSIPKQTIKDILIAHSANGILNVPKEYGMFIAS